MVGEIKSSYLQRRKPSPEFLRHVFLEKEVIMKRWVQWEYNNARYAGLSFRHFVSLFKNVFYFTLVCNFQNF